MRSLSVALVMFAMVGCGSTKRVDEISALDGDPANGAVVFADNCAGCHGADGTGGSGPNITNEGEKDEVIEVIVDGEGDMPSFDGDLTDQEIADVAAYVTGGFAG